MPVGVVERARDLAGDAQRFVQRKLALAIEPRAQRFAGDVRHHVVQLAVRLARVVDGEDVRVAQVRCELDLTAEALRAKSKAQFRKKHLDGDFSMEFEIPRQVDRGHCPVTELTLDLVMFGDAGFNAVELGRHTSGETRCLPANYTAVSQCTPDTAVSPLLS